MMKYETEDTDCFTDISNNHNYQIKIIISLFYLIANYLIKTLDTYVKKTNNHHILIHLDFCVCIFRIF